MKEKTIAQYRLNPVDIEESTLFSACARILNDSVLHSFSLQLKVARSLDQILNKRGIKKIISLPAKAAAAISQSGSVEPQDIRDTAIVCTAIGIAGWSAWMNMDIIRDDGGGKRTEILSLASLMMSVTYSSLKDLGLESPDSDRISALFGKMEQANIDENGHRHSDIATSLLIPKMGVRKCTHSKSAGAAVPLLSFMMKIGADARDISACEEYFKHLISARQLSDDSMDWWEDRERGISTLMTEWLDETIHGLSLSPDDTNLSRVIDEKISPRIAREILRHARLSISYARKMTCFTSTEFLEELPRHYEEEAIRELKKLGKWP